jgi:hypothetical protein
VDHERVSAARNAAFQNWSARKPVAEDTDERDWRDHESFSSRLWASGRIHSLPDYVTDYDIATVNATG